MAQLLQSAIQALSKQGQYHEKSPWASQNLHKTEIFKEDGSLTYNQWEAKWNRWANEVRLWDKPTEFQLKCFEDHLGDKPKLQLQSFSAEIREDIDALRDALREHYQGPHTQQDWENEFAMISRKPDEAFPVFRIRAIKACRKAFPSATEEDRNQRVMERMRTGLDPSRWAAVRKALSCDPMAIRNPERVARILQIDEDVIALKKDSHANQNNRQNSQSQQNNLAKTQPATQSPTFTPNVQARPVQQTFQQVQPQRFTPQYFPTAPRPAAPAAPPVQQVQTQTQSRPVQAPTQAVGARPAAPGPRTFNCQGTDHIKKDCPHPLKTRQQVAVNAVEPAAWQWTPVFEQQTQQQQQVYDPNTGQQFTLAYPPQMGMTYPFPGASTQGYILTEVPADANTEVVTEVVEQAQDPNVVPVAAQVPATNQGTTGAQEEAKKD
jgi:hypothetical protein